MDSKSNDFADVIAKETAEHATHLRTGKILLKFQDKSNVEDVTVKINPKGTALLNRLVV